MRSILSHIARIKPNLSEISNLCSILNRRELIFFKVRGFEHSTFRALILTFSMEIATRNNRLVGALNRFDEMPMRYVVSWNSMTRGCVKIGNIKTAMNLLDEMPERNMVS